MNALKRKHHTLLNNITNAGKYVEPIIFDGIDAQPIQQAARSTYGCGGSSKIDSAHGNRCFAQKNKALLSNCFIGKNYEQGGGGSGTTKGTTGLKANTT